MAQHDYTIANADGAGFRADVNNALAAIASQNSGATAPATPHAYMVWADTANNRLKVRNAANDAWVEVMVLSTGEPVNASVLKSSHIGSTVQGYDADILKADVADVLTRGFASTAVAITDSATPSIDLTAANFFTWTLGAGRTLPNLTLPGAGVWAILLSGSYTLSLNAAWTADNGSTDPGTGTRVLYIYSANGSEKRVFFDDRS
jgi:hypothetical protein